MLAAGSHSPVMAAVSQRPPALCPTLHARLVSSPVLHSSKVVKGKDFVRHVQSIRRQADNGNGLFVTIDWASDKEVHDEMSNQYKEAMLERFKAADTDGNGVIDKEELWRLLEATDGGKQLEGTEGHWMSEEEVDRVMKQYDGGAGVLSLAQFAKLTEDGVLLEGKLEEYRAAFNAVDNGGNGTISATEIAQMFQNLGTPLSYDKLVKVMAKYDVDKSGQIDFYEFLRMFRDELLDLKEILEYIKMQPSPKTMQQSKNETNRSPGAVTGTVNVIFSEAEFDKVLQEAGNGLVVLMATLTWCRPCKAFGPQYEKLSNHYPDVTFVKFYGNSSDDTKEMFKNRLKARVTPTFYFFRNGKQVHCHTGANKSRLEHFMREVQHEAGISLPNALYAPYVDPKLQNAVEAQGA